jgi:hypothetical protein
MSDVAAAPELIVSITPFLVSIPTAADLIGRSVSFIYYAIADGKIAAVKSDKDLGRRRFAARVRSQPAACEDQADLPAPAAPKEAKSEVT